MPKIKEIIKQPIEYPTEKRTNGDSLGKEFIAKEPRVARIAKKFLEEAGIVEYSYKIVNIGDRKEVLFNIKLPEEDRQFRKEQVNGLNGFLDTPPFVKTKIIPLILKIKQETKFDCKIEKEDVMNLMVVIRVFKNKNKVPYI